jgi:methylase of polypeptide subunit release factors
MKRAPLSHSRVFSDRDYAEAYARQHQGMAEKFGQEYRKKLSARRFVQGRIIDVGCGSGALGLVLAKRFVDSEIIGIDLSEPLIQLARKAAQESNLGDRLRFEARGIH